MGVRGTDHGHLMFDRAPVPLSNRLGDEGDGLAIALSGFLAPSRIAVGMTCVGLASRALELAVSYAQRRETFGRKIAERQAIAFRLAEMATDLFAARALVLDAARLWESSGAANAETLRGISERGVSGMSIRADLEQLDEIERMFAEIEERFGRLDYFVSNAAASNFRSLMELKPHNLERTFNLNVRAFVVSVQR